MGYRWILFDADGTLFDYESAERAALERVWSDLGLEPPDGLLDLYRRINGELWKRLESGEVSGDEIKAERFRLLLEELGLDTDPIRLSDAYLRALSRQTQLLDGAERTLGAIDGTRRLALITNGLAEVQRPRLRRSPIGQRFEVVVISEEVGFAKPDPRIFEHALERMERPARERVLMVGDNPLADIEGARSFGLATCWLNLDGRAESGPVASDHEVHSLDDLEARLA